MTTDQSSINTPQRAREVYANPKDRWADGANEAELGLPVSLHTALESGPLNQPTDSKNERIKGIHTGVT
jgi:hypothetical protein